MTFDSSIKTRRRNTIENPICRNTIDNFCVVFVSYLILHVSEYDLTLGGFICSIINVFSIRPRTITWIQSKRINTCDTVEKNPTTCVPGMFAHEQVSRDDSLDEAGSRFVTRGPWTELAHRQVRWLPVLEHRDHRTSAISSPYQKIRLCLFVPWPSP